MRLVLFDIDGTLLRSRGAGRQALDVAFAEILGWEDATRGVWIAGSTDAAIFRDVAALRGATLGEETFEAVKTAYLRCLGTLLAEPGRAELCPGVPSALGALEGRAHVALLTGNWSEGARIKLDSVGLSFPWGAFAEDAHHRDDLVPVARRRAAERGLSFDEVVVVGDTVADVRCARAGGARSIIVETGFSTPAELIEEGPDLQIRDLADGLDAFLAAALG
jgi:phosphoglycolate phosphatase-like HAD superfamily hydrolase